MPMPKMILLAGAAAMTPLAMVHAAPPETHAVAVEGEQAVADMADAMTAAQQREMDEAMAMVAKIFDTSDLPPIEPARLTLAGTTSAALIPEGSLARMMENLYGRIFNEFLEQTGGVSDRSLAIDTGLEKDAIAALAPETRIAVADLLDPHREERNAQTMSLIKPLVADVLADMEPPMRAGLARAYARRFSADQLTQINGFFATPAGRAYASEAMALQTDPEVMLAMIEAVPSLFTKFLARAPRIEGKIKELPKKKTLGELTDAELATLADLVKVDVAKLKENRDQWRSSADIAEAAADAIGGVADEPAYDPENWSEADRKRVEDLQAAASVANATALEAELDAIDNARERLGDNPPTE